MKNWPLSSDGDVSGKTRWKDCTCTHMRLLPLIFINTIIIIIIILFCTKDMNWNNRFTNGKFLYNF